jgi:hypothetical protein
LAKSKTSGGSPTRKKAAPPASVSAVPTPVGAEGRAKRRLDELSAEGTKLYFRLYYEARPDQFESREGALQAVKKFPPFSEGYQRWYTEALELLRQTFPSRVEDFVGYLNPPKNRKDISYSTYTISDALRGIRIENGFGEVKVDRFGAVDPMLQQVRIIEAVRDSIDSVLVNLRSELQANLFDDDLDAARELNSKGFPRAAGMIAGVVMEGHLREAASRHRVTTSKNPTISTLNDALKDAGVLDLHIWRRVQAVGDVRNNCGHKTGAEPRKEDVARMIDDVSDLIKRIA